MKILIATKNSGKIEGAKKAFERYFNNFTIEGYSVPSNVSEQPKNQETFLGAKNRVKNLKEFAKQNNIKADLYISIESGIYNTIGNWVITNIAVIEDDFGFESYGTSPSFPVPERLVKEILETDLSQVMNKILGEDNERRNQGGAIQTLTKNQLSRIDLTELAFVMALTRYLNKDIWA